MKATKNSRITIYTDGAARGNPGPAGWAAVMIFSSQTPPGLPLSREDKNFPLTRGSKGVVEIGGRVEHATNNQMELRAVIEALKFTARLSLAVETEIISDSKYVILGITEWIKNWMQKDWRGANKKPVMNRELWEELYELDQEIKPKWDYVEGHNGDKWNDRADEIATSFADNDPVKLRKQNVG